KIFLMATPLHSQNFVDIDDGILINNRRLVTKAMWFNGTQISGQARRALENERVTVVSHVSGWVHIMRRRATIDQNAYDEFSEKLRGYLKAPLTPELLGNFLRQNPKCRQCFVVRWPVRGVNRYIALEQVFSFEQDSPYKVTDNTREKLLATIPLEMFDASCCPCKIILNDLEQFVAERAIDLEAPEDLAALKSRIGDACMSAAEMVGQLTRFCHTEPRLPSADKVSFEREAEPLGLSVDMEREDVVRRLDSLRGSSVTADLAFHTWRDLSRTPCRPFVKAALERNPVSAAGAKDMTEDAVVALAGSWPDESIYDGPERMAQPDEVWNFRRGDGFEKALMVANILRSRGCGAMRLNLTGSEVRLLAGSREVCAFNTGKRPTDRIWEL
ncbi:MAG: hypothetical protein PHU80_11565, partial [Kiritimatiellae bacterium]|nr:hypothetical protein [Kiritimatiellia bacterium]